MTLNSDDQLKLINHLAKLQPDDLVNATVKMVEEYEEFRRGVCGVLTQAYDIMNRSKGFVAAAGDRELLEHLTEWIENYRVVMEGSCEKLKN